MILACVPRLIMCVLFIFASQVWMLILGRAICGLSDAFIIAVAATYISEIASVSNIFPDCPHGKLCFRCMYSQQHKLVISLGAYVIFKSHL